VYPNDWRADLRELAGSEPDIVRILVGMRDRYPSFGREPFRVMVALRDEFGLLPRQLNYVAGWFAGNVDDDELRQQIFGTATA
jgi:hypothetical protein